MVMNSSRRKRDRTETEGKSTTVNRIDGTSSRQNEGEGSRGALDQKQLNCSLGKQDIDSTTLSGGVPEGVHHNNNISQNTLQKPPEIHHANTSVETSGVPVSDKAQNANAPSAGAQTPEIADEAKLKTAQASEVQSSENGNPSQANRALHEAVDKAGHSSDVEPSMISWDCIVMEDNESRESKICALISHRKILLKRIKECRLSSESRIKLLQGQIGGGIDEVAKFRDISNEAMQSAKKRGSDVGVEGTRGSISLRQSSSVGKRFTAPKAPTMAQSTDTEPPIFSGRSNFMPSAPTTQSISRASVKPDTQTPITTSAAAKNTMPRRDQSASISSAMLARSSSNHDFPSAPLPHNPLVDPSTNMYASSSVSTIKGSTYKRPVPLANVHPAPATVTSSTKPMGSKAQLERQSSKSGSSAAPKLKRSNSQRSMKMQTSGNHGLGINSSSVDANTSRGPLHLGAIHSSLPANNLLQKPRSVVCPEVFALRERRGAIQAKLDKLRKGQEVRMTNERAEGLSSARATRSSAVDGLARALNGKLVDDRSVRLYSFGNFHAGEKTGELRVSRSHPIEAASLRKAKALPHRRKTHWDVLLHEMKWMATDFIEERKWKRSILQGLGADVLSGHGRQKFIEAEDRGQSERVRNGNRETSSGVGYKEPLQTLVRQHDDDGANEVSPMKYCRPSRSDIEVARNTSKLITLILSEHWKITKDTGVFPRTDKRYAEAFENYKTLRASLPISSKLGKNNVVDNTSDDANQDKNYLSQSSGHVHAPHVSDSDDFPEQEITGKIIELVSEISRRLEEVSDNEVSKVEVEGLKNFELCLEQKDAICSVEKVWDSRGDMGALLRVSPSFEVSIAVCSLLWRHRNDGPQLLLCNPASMLRWQHELRQFGDLSVFLFGPHAESYGRQYTTRDQVNKFGMCDVILCERLALDAIVEEGLELENMKGILIDARESGFHINHSMVNEDDSAWWRQLIRLSPMVPVKRLILEHDVTDDEGTTTEDEERLVKDPVLCRLAFVLPPSIFAGKQFVAKKVLSWARRVSGRPVEGVKSLSDFSAKTPSQIVSELVLQCSINFGKEKLDGSSESRGQETRQPKELATHAPIRWDVRLCPMTSTQRTAYEECCWMLRGPLSRPLEARSSTTPTGERILDRSSICQVSDRRHHIQAALALLKLRRCCILPSLNAQIGKESLSKVNSVSRPSALSSWGCYKARWPLGNRSDNPSQPDIDFAMNVLAASSKMRELLAILKFECGHDFCSEKLLRNHLPARKEKRAGSTDEKKVVILASMPEAIILVSDLLNAVGVAHNALMIGSSRIWNSLDESSTVKSVQAEQATVSSVLSWNESQVSLARFNCNDRRGKDENVRRAMPSCNVLVMPPTVVAPEHCGFGISAADYVVSVDEHWSGRNEDIMKYLVARRVSPGCNFIRLVCSETIEENILAFSPGNPSFDESRKAGASGFRQDTLAPQTKDRRKRGLRRSTRKEHETSTDVAAHLPPELVTDVERLQSVGLKQVLQTSRSFPVDLLSGNFVRFLPNEKIRAEKQKTPLDCGAPVNSTSAKKSSGHFRAALESIEMNGIHNSSAPTSVVSGKTGFLVPQNEKKIPATLVPPQLCAGLLFRFSRKDVISLSTRAFVKYFAEEVVKRELMVISETGSTSWCRQGHVDEGFRGSNSSRAEKPPEGKDCSLSFSKHGNFQEKRPSFLFFYSIDHEAARAREREFTTKAPVETAPQSEEQQNVLKRKKKNRMSIDTASSTHEANSALTDKDQKMFNVPEATSEGRKRLCLPTSVGASVSAGSILVSCLPPRDGNQGTEPYVYVPSHLTPYLAPSSSHEINAAEVQQGRIFSAFDLSSSFKKRKDPINTISEQVTGGKRPKLTHGVPLDSGIGDSFFSAGREFGPCGDGNFFPTAGPNFSSNIHGSVPGATELKDVSNLADGEILSSVDGLILNSPSNISIETAHCASCGAFETDDDFLSGEAACDAEATDEELFSQASARCLRSVLLVVPKRQKRYPSGFITPSSTKQGPLHPPETSINSVIGSNLLPANVVRSGCVPSMIGSSEAHTGTHIGIPGTVNSIGFTKAPNAGKKLKRQNSSGSVSGIAFQPNHSFPNGQGSVSTMVTPGVMPSDYVDGTRLKPALDPRSAHGAVGAMSVGHKAYNLALVRLRNRVSARVSAAFIAAAADVGPGVPLIAMDAKVPTSHTKKLVSGEGNQDGEIPPACETVICRSLVPPRYVDFGPFQVGFLSSPTGMAGVSPPLSKKGVSLPLGVKLPKVALQGPKDFVEQKQNWRQWEDEIIENCAQKYGSNWHLASRIVSRRQTPTNNDTSHFRSARQCAERWKVISKTDFIFDKYPGEGRAPVQGHSEVAMDIARASSEKLNAGLDKVSSKKFEIDEVSTSEDIVIPPHLLRKSPGMPLIRNPKLSMMKSATSRSQHIAMTIPGYTGAGTPLPVASSHPSHSQAVQAAITTAVSNGMALCAEMWPLQLLELADKQRANARKPTVSSFQTQQTIHRSDRQHVASSSSARHPRQGQMAHNTSMPQNQGSSVVPQRHSSRSPLKRAALPTSAVQSAQTSAKSNVNVPYDGAQVDVSPMRPPSGGGNTKKH